MQRSRDLKAELHELEAELCLCFQNTMVSKQFRAELMLGVIALELMLRRLSNSRDLRERRRIKEEFLDGARIVREGLQLLWQTQPKVTTTLTKQAVQSGGRFLSESLPLAFEGKELPTFKTGGEKHVERTN